MSTIVKIKKNDTKARNVSHLIWVYSSLYTCVNSYNFFRKPIRFRLLIDRKAKNVQQCI